ncbi:MAG: 4Fe-4S binding protein [Acidaminococcaceae bacterium]|nr:4Fe-4S binding protein [Acidaminococcaceae bacterium]
MFKFLFIIYIAFLFMGLFRPILGIFSVLLFVLPIFILAPFSGRWWCAHLCPHGSFQDLFGLFIRHRRPLWLKSHWLRYGMFIIMFGFLGYIVFSKWGNWPSMGLALTKLLWSSTIMSIGLMTIAPARSWCNICPAGTVGKMLAPKKAKLMITTDCVYCRLCAKTCPMGLSPYKDRGKISGFTNPDCMRCGRCASFCFKHAIKIQ